MLLITGGSGFIGKYLSAHILLNTSDKIRIFSSSPDKFHTGLENILLSAINHILHLGSTGFYSKDLIDNAKIRYKNRQSIITENLELVQGDITDQTNLQDSIEGVNTVIHAAGILNPRRERTLEKVNYYGTKNLLDVMLQNNIQPLINIGILGTSPNPKLRFHYSKWKSEEAIKNSGIQFKLFKSSLVLGAEDNFTKKISRTLSLPSIFFPFPKSKESFFQPILVNDLATAVLSCLQSKSSESSTYEIGGPEYFSFQEMVRIYLDKFNKKRLLVPVPQKLLLPPVKILELIMEEPFLTQEELQGLSQKNIADLDSVNRFFGFSPLTIKENLIL